MTKEKVMEILNVVLKTERAYQYRKEEVNEAFDIAIEALEQQPNRCDSCVHSEEQDGSNCYECVKGMTDKFETQPKTGYWIKMGDGFTPYECSECEKIEFMKSNYCPNCGAKMEVEE